MRNESHILPHILSANTVEMYQLHTLAFFASFIIGMFVVYIMSPPPVVIVKFPTPYNAGKVLYKDDSDTCYVFEARKEQCTTEAVQQPLNI